MSTLVQEISAAIAAKVRLVSGIQDVYEFEVGKPTNGRYPFATVTPKDFKGQFGDTVRNIRTHGFVLNIYQERTEAGFGNEKAERIIREITDEVLTAFDNDTTISGVCKWVEPVYGNLEYVQREINDVRICQLNLDCVVVVPSIT